MKHILNCVRCAAMDLDVDLLSRVLSYLSAGDLCSASLVSRRWRQLTVPLQARAAESSESSSAGRRAYRLGFLEGVDAGRESALQEGFESGFAEACTQQPERSEAQHKGTLLAQQAIHLKVTAVVLQGNGTTTTTTERGTA